MRDVGEAGAGGGDVDDETVEKRGIRARLAMFEKLTGHHTAYVRDVDGTSEEFGDETKDEVSVQQSMDDEQRSDTYEQREYEEEDTTVMIRQAAEAAAAEDVIEASEEYKPDESISLEETANVENVDEASTIFEVDMDEAAAVEVEVNVEVAEDSEKSDIELSDDAPTEEREEELGTQSEVKEHEDAMAEHEDVMADVVVTTQEYLETQPPPPPVLDEDVKKEEEEDIVAGEDGDTSSAASHVVSSTLDVRLSPSRHRSDAPTDEKVEEPCQTMQQTFVEFEAGATAMASTELSRSEAFVTLTQVNREQEKKGRGESLDDIEKTVVVQNKSEVHGEAVKQQEARGKTHIKFAACVEKPFTDPLDQFRRKSRQQLHPRFSDGSLKEYEETMGLKREPVPGEVPDWTDIQLRHVDEDQNVQETGSNDDKEEERSEVKEWKRAQSKKFSIKSRIKVFEQITQEVSPATSPATSPTRTSQHEAWKSFHVMPTVSEQASVDRQSSPIKEEVEMMRVELVQSAVIPDIIIPSQGSGSLDSDDEEQLVVSSTPTKARLEDNAEQTTKVKVLQSELPLPAPSLQLELSEVVTEMVRTPTSQKSVDKSYLLESMEEVDDYVVYQSDDVEEADWSGEEDATERKQPVEERQNVEEPSETHMQSDVEQTPIVTLDDLQPRGVSQWKLVYGVTPTVEISSEDDDHTSSRSHARSMDEIQEISEEQLDEVDIPPHSTATTSKGNVQMVKKLSIESDESSSIIITDDDESVTELATEFLRSGEVSNDKVKPMEIKTDGLVRVVISEFSPDDCKDHEARETEQRLISQQPSAPAPIPPVTTARPPSEPEAMNEAAAATADTAKVISYVCLS